MRNYPRNSPEAAARIVALVLISDGHVCRSEVEALHDIERDLGITSQRFAQVMQTMCEDLLMGAHAGDGIASLVDDMTLAAWMAEVDEPVLQHSVLRVASRAASADRHLAEPEARLLALARSRWGMPLASPAPDPGPRALQAA